MLVENFAEQGEGRRNPDGFRGRQRSYAEFYTTDVKVFYLIIVLVSSFDRFATKRSKPLLKNIYNKLHIDYI